MILTLDLKQGQLDIDESLAPVAVWLDLLRSVQVVSSDPGEKGRFKPRVFFTSYSNADIVTILSKREGDYQLLIDVDRGELVYTMRFHSKNCVRNFKSRLDLHELC